MTKHLTRRVRGFLLSQFPGHVLLLLFIWIVFNIRVWVFFSVLYAAIILAAFLYELFKAWRIGRELIYAEQTMRQMNLIRDLIDLAFVYDEKPEKFYKKFLEMISVPSLSKRGIIDPDPLLRTPKYNRMCKSLKRKDAELWTLLMAGFSSRELKVIYGLTNINSVYIKCHRLRSRLNKQMLDLLNNQKF